MGRAAALDQSASTSAMLLAVFTLESQYSSCPGSQQPRIRCWL